ncbi:hypothetical protein V1512DRAFT_264207 [Lipomyces arxii]|uniref:uncharacterized protein n=1 Tax=Lipomyces arxii TaxID=56418 RepID=UPI0034CF7429
MFGCKSVALSLWVRIGPKSRYNVVKKEMMHSSVRVCKFVPSNSNLSSFLLSSNTSSAHHTPEPVSSRREILPLGNSRIPSPVTVRSRLNISEERDDMNLGVRSAINDERKRLEQELEAVQKIETEDGLEDDVDPKLEVPKFDSRLSSSAPVLPVGVSGLGKKKQNKQKSKESATDQTDLKRDKTRKWTRSAIEDLLLERRLIHKATSQGNLVRCTVFDLDGNVSVVSGEFKKSELLSKHGLLPRDLRKLDSHTTMPSILVRNNSILVNLLHIRALVKADMVLLFDVYGSTDSQTQSVFMYDLEGKLRQGSKAMGGLPYEMRALEAILISVVTALDAEMKVHTTIVAGILADLENDIERENLRHLLIQSKALAQFLQKATLVRDAIDDILEQDDDLAGMYLSEKMRGVMRPPDQHSEVEMLMESYYKHCDEIVQATDITMSNVHTTEEIVNIILDANRNSLMLLDLKVSIGTMGLGAGAFVAALYGMNLKNYMEDWAGGFWGVSGITGVIVCVIVVSGFRNLRRLRRVTMREGRLEPKSSMFINRMKVRRSRYRQIWRHKS